MVPPFCPKNVCCCLFSSWDLVASQVTGELQAAEFWCLGLGNPWPISGLHGDGVSYCMSVNVISYARGPFWRSLTGVGARSLLFWWWWWAHDVDVFLRSQELKIAGAWSSWFQIFFVRVVLVWFGLV